ncbi:MAG: 2-phospho-L-lactate transferase [Actinomycetota bacterium]
MKIAALAGGVGGAKLLVGLQRVVGPNLTAIVNTGDDARFYGVHVSPDVDIVTYWLAGIADTERGWGIKSDTFHMIEALAALGMETWFALGDRDFATCAFRTERLRSGATLSAVTDEIRRSLGIAPRIIPMSDNQVRTHIVTNDDRTLEFQEYFVREKQQPHVASVQFASQSETKAAPGVLDAIADADMVVLCPSNPIVSVAPILFLDGVRDALCAHERVIAVTPIVRGAPLKGPADKLLAASGVEISASGVAGLYSDFCDTFVVDASDSDEVSKVEALGLAAVALDTLMTDHDASESLAGDLLNL